MLAIRKSSKDVNPRPGPGLPIMRHTANHHHSGAQVAKDLDLGKCFLVSIGSFPLQQPRVLVLAPVAEPQLVGGGLLQDVHKRNLIRLLTQLGDCHV